MSEIGILTTDTELVVTTWDAGLERMTGIAADTARGRRLDDIVPDIKARMILDLIREPLVSGSAQVLAPAIHRYLIPCRPIETSEEFDHMQQRVVVGALRDEHQVVGLVMSIEDVTGRLERERQLSRQLRDSSPVARLQAIEQLTPLSPVGGLGPLSDAIGDEDWRVRRAAVRALANRRDDALVDTVIDALREGHRNFSVLSSALQLLQLTGVDSAKALVRLIRDPDPDLRIQAALALGTQRGPEAVEALLTALGDEDPNVRFHAIESIGRLAPAAAIEALTAIAESRDFFLAFPAIEALVRINDPLVAPRLAPLLDDPMLGTATAEALGHIGDEDAVGPLVTAVEHPATAVGSIVEAIVRIHDRYELLLQGGDEIKDVVQRRLSPAGIARVLAAIQSASPDGMRPLITLLGWLRDPAIPAALVRLLGAEDTRHDVVEAFVRFGSSAVELLIEQLHQENTEIRRAAISALGRIGDRRAVPALAALLQEGDRPVRIAAASALARLGDPRAFEPLLSLLGDEHVAVRQAAIGALNSIGHPEMGSRIRQMLAEPDPLLRESAVKIGGYFGYPECVDAVLERCTDNDESVRAAALEHLPYFDDPRAVVELAAALERDTPRARAAAAKALGALPNEEALALSRKAMTDPDPWVRYFSAIAMGQGCGAAELPSLVAMASGDPAPHVRVAAIEAIGLCAGADSLRLLEPFLAEEGDIGLAAIRAIGRDGADTPIPVLRDVLRSSDAARRAAAVDALVKCGGPDAVEPLQWTASTDDDQTVTTSALHGLGTIANRNDAGSNAAVRALLFILADTDRRAAALDVLGRLAPAAIPVIAESLGSDDPRTRRSVAEALGRLSHSAASAFLQRALSDDDAAVRCEAVRALSRRGTRGLTRQFASMAETDSSPAVRQAAAAALSRHSGVREGGE